MGGGSKSLVFYVEATWVSEQLISSIIFKVWEKNSNIAFYQNKISKSLVRDFFYMLMVFLNCGQAVGK